MNKETSFISDENKLEHFRNTAINSAKEKALKIDEEISKYKQEFFKRENLIIEDEVKQYEKSKIFEAEKDIASSLSDYAMKCRFELLQLRKNFTREIFSQIEEKLNEFHNSKEYYSFLCALALKCINTCNKDVEITLSCSDECYKTELSQYLSENTNNRNITFAFDESIIFGGLRVLDLQTKLLINETLDERLNNEKDNFSL